MPELPEVHTITQDLKENVVGFEIENIKISKDYRIPKDVVVKLKGLMGEKITDAERIAKNIALKMSNGMFLVFHLAMTGRILLRSEKEKKDKWVKVVFEITKNGQTKYLKFCDMRQFGKIQVLNNVKLGELEQKYGLRVINDRTTPEEFHKSIKAKKTNIKNALLDQKIVSGLGNIYATDALFMAGINPKTSTQDINYKLAKKLLKSSRDILKEGIKNRGSTLPDKMYVDIFGKSGNQQKYFRIYGKDICPSCGSKVQYEKLNGRGTYFCPVCQPEIRAIDSTDSKQKKLL
jgi:formamidopyrimidine-DNA glycosylase